jgi:Ser/Thr protein kinase RdoA (MazF antagonist)
VPVRAYAELTDRGRQRRLATLARAAIEHWPIEVARCRLIAEHTNATFRIDTTDGHRYALRVCAPGEHSHEDHEIEVDWMAAIAAETEVLLPRPVAARDGSFLVEVAAAGVPEARLCLMSEWVPGRPLEDQPHHLPLLGEAMARLHVHALSYRPPRGLQPMVCDRAFYWTHEPVSVYDGSHGLVTARQARELRSIEVRVNDLLARLHSSSDAPTRVIHGDLHDGNAHVSRGRLWVIDFEDLVVGTPSQDIANALYGPRWRPDFRAAHDAVKEGYERILPWPVEDDQELELLFRARALMLLNYCVNQRADPDLAEFVPVLLGRLLGASGTPS